MLISGNQVSYWVSEQHQRHYLACFQLVKLIWSYLSEIERKLNDFTTTGGIIVNRRNRFVSRCKPITIKFGIIVHGCSLMVGEDFQENYRVKHYLGQSMGC